MKLFFPSPSHPSSRFDTFAEQSEIRDRGCLDICREKEFSPTNTPRLAGYQKPKHLWMAKDQSMNVVNSISEVNTEESSVCSMSFANSESHLTSEHGFAPHPLSELTPLRSSCNGMSPSNSSSAPGTVAMPSSFTNTSSSPSNHPSPQNRSGVNAISSHYESPVISYPSQLVAGDSYNLKPKRKRGRPPKTKPDETRVSNPLINRKHQSQVNVIASGDCSVPKARTCSGFLTGGLKIRLRRDVSVEEPACGKKYRSRKSTHKSAQVFRIVESWCDADAPGRFAAKPSATSPMSTNQTSQGLRVGDVVWAKLAGYPYWPSRISALYERTPHQLAQVNIDSVNNDAFAVFAGPVDPALATGFTAKVEWFAWNQCSYVSYAKLFPFVEYFTKLYNPRTRVKNYAEAVSMARRVVEVGLDETQLSSSCNDSVKESSSTQPLSTYVEHDHSTIPCPSDFPLPSIPNDKSRQSNAYFDLRPSFNSTDPSFSTGGDQTMGENCHSPFLDLRVNPGEFDQIPEPCWGPLPQLDVSGLKDFVSGVPTFSEDDEESSESLANQLKSGLGSIGI